MLRDTFLPVLPNRFNAEYQGWAARARAGRDCGTVKAHGASTLEPTGFHERQHLGGSVDRTLRNLFLAGGFYVEQCIVEKPCQQ